jgi:D-sedoheptulose 7-phosphate isomerase
LTSAGRLWILDDMMITIQNTVTESLELKKAFFQANEDLIIRAAREICAAFQTGHQVLLYGNGGSAADAQHIAAEFVGKFQRDRKAFPAIALTTDASILTAVANDYGFDQIFARQVRALGHKGDIAIAISTSGNSGNRINHHRLDRQGWWEIG